MSSDPTAKDVAAARRRERLTALWACRPKERRFLRQLPKSRYALYPAGEAIGISSRTVWKMVNRPRVRRAMAVFLEDALEQIGISHTSLVADLQHIKELCIKHLVTDPKAAAGAIAAVGKLMELTGYVPAKRLELTTRDGSALAAPVFHISFEDGGPGDYGIEVSGTPGNNSPGSESLN